MKILLSIIIASTLTIFVCVEQIYGQSKAESIEWINSLGEEYLKEITGNNSIQWELDDYGSLRITDNKPNIIRDNQKLVKRYAFVNLFELDPNQVSIRKFSIDPDSSVIEINCLKERSNCLKFRNHFDRTKFKAEESSVYRFKLIESYSTQKAKAIGNHLSHLIRIIQE